MPKSTRWLRWGALGLLVAVLGVYLLVRGKKEEKSPRIDTAVVDRGELIAKVTATGTASAIVTVQVGSQVSGRLQEILVDFNSPVSKGQVLARIDPRLFLAAKEQASANVIAARSNLEKARAEELEARRNLKRAQVLAGRKLIATAELDSARAKADAATASVSASLGTLAQARASLHQAEVNLAYTTIVSPTEGVVISRNVDVGQTVAASFQAPTLFVIAQDLRRMQVDTSVAEADVGRLTAGMEATFFVDAYPGRNFQGAVRQIRNAPQTQQNVVTYDAVVDVDNEDLALKPGMTATVTFVYAHRNDVLRIPNSALRFAPSPELVASWETGPGKKRLGRRPGGSPPPAPKSIEPPKEGERLVWVMRQKPEKVVLSTGVSDGTLTEITGGPIKEGDRVVVDAAEPNQPPPPGSRGFRMF